MCEENRQLYHLYCDYCGNLFWIDEGFPNFCSFFGIRMAKNLKCYSCKHHTKYINKEEYEKGKLPYECKLYPKCENYELWEASEEWLMKS